MMVPADFIMSLADLLTDISDGGQFVFITRQSSRNNLKSHKIYATVLERVHAQLSLPKPFVLHSFVGSGKVNFLKHAFDSGKVDEWIRGTYFEWLVNVLWHALAKMPEGKKLYVIFASIDRMFRPIGYAPQGGTETWEFDAESCELFRRLIVHYFNERSEDIVFVSVNDGTPEQCRVWQTKLGQAGNVGGRPRRHSKAQVLENILQLAAKDMNAGQIKRYLSAKYGVDIPLRTIQYRTRKAKLSAKAGRPRGKKYTNLMTSNNSDTDMTSTFVASNSVREKDHDSKPSVQQATQQIKKLCREEDTKSISVKQLNTPLTLNNRKEIDMSKSYFEQDFEGFVGDFIDLYFVQDEDKLLVYLDGSLHRYNGTHYESLGDSHRNIMGQVREYVRKLSLADKKGKPVATPTSPTFYKAFRKTLEELCIPTDSELEFFQHLDNDLVFGKTKAYRISTGQFEPYNHLIRNRFTLDFDVAEDDYEPPVWKEFFDAAQMDESQQLSWWRQRSVIVMRDNTHNRIFYNFGNPRSGKGTTTAIDTAFFGRNGVGAIPRSIGRNTHTGTIIVGKSLLTINDMKFDRYVNNSFIQFLLNLVGGDPISINPKHKQPYDYYSKANLVISSNEMPNFKGNLSGLENKFMFNVFRRSEDKPVDITLKERMLETLPHIIRKAIKMYPETVESMYDFDTEQGRKVSEQFAEAASVSIRYIEEHCVLGEGFNDSSQYVYNDLCEFVKQQGEHKPNQPQFQNEIMTHFLGKIGKTRIVAKDGKKVTVLTGMHRIGLGNTINDPIPKPVRPSLPNNRAGDLEDPNFVPF